MAGVVFLNYNRHTYKVFIVLLKQLKKLHTMHQEMSKILGYA